MSRRTLVSAVAAVAFFAGWVLPVAGDYRGWQAFRVGLSPIWPYQRFDFSAWPDAALTIASALTNVVFVAALVDVAGAQRATARFTAWVMLGSLLVNLHWLVRAGAQWQQVQAGYYVWLVAFPLLALAARQPGKRE